ncbi:hypothetical protein ACF0H5_014167 [Mactra antiquata]
MAGILTQTYVAEELFRKCGKYPSMEVLDTHNISNNNSVDNFDDKTDQFNGNRIRVLKRNVIIINHPLAKKFGVSGPVVSAVNAPKPSIADKTNCVDFNTLKKNDKHKANSKEILLKDDNDSLSKYKHHKSIAINKCALNLSVDKAQYVRLPDIGCGTVINPYRCTTSMDDTGTNVEMDNYDNANTFEGLDLDEGRRIWNEVDKIICRSHSGYRRQAAISDRSSFSNDSALSDKGSHNKSLKRFRYLLNSIEFSPRFNNTKPIQSWRHLNRIWSYEGIQSDTEGRKNNGTSNSDAIGSRKISNVFPAPEDIETRVLDKRWTGLVNNIWSTIDVSTGTKEDIYRNPYRHHLDTRWVR